MDIPQPIPYPATIPNQRPEYIETYPNIFVSPFGNDSIITAYSSIPIASAQANNCLPCVICGNSSQIHQILIEEAFKLQSAFYTGVETTIG